MGSCTLSLCTYPAITKGLFQALPFPWGTWKIHTSGKLTLGEATYGMGGSRGPREKEVSLLGKIKAYFLEEVPVRWASKGEKGAPPSNCFLPSPSLEPYDGDSENSGLSPRGEENQGPRSPQGDS